MSRPWNRCAAPAVLLSVTTAFAQTEPAGITPGVSPPPPQPKVALQLRINVAWQVALEGADFSPGIIDGVFKRKSLMALGEYAARNFPNLTPPDQKIYEASFQSLKVDIEGAFASYVISADDAAQVGGPLPDDWNEKAQLKRLNYESMVDCIAEKFHCTRGLLETLNPGVKMDLLEPGTRLWVPNIRPFPTDNRVTVTKHATNTGGVTVNLGEKTIRVYDKDGNELALFHCSIAKDKNKLPDRDTKVQTIASPNPNYTFNPEVWPEVHNVHRTLIIPPGPRNPVGLSWVSLDLPGYGIHGTPKPELIGKTGSHGCFRLTNWDALKFAGFVREGLAVKIVNPDKEPQ